MQTTSANDHWVLHVGADLLPPVQPNSVRIERRPDVYSALARMLAAKSHPPQHVLVSVDELLPGESEFFDLLARHFPGVPIRRHGCQYARLDAPESGSAIAAPVIERTPPRVAESMPRDPVPFPSRAPMHDQRGSVETQPASEAQEAEKRAVDIGSAPTVPIESTESARVEPSEPCLLQESPIEPDGDFEKDVPHAQQSERERTFATPMDSPSGEMIPDEGDPDPDGSQSARVPWKSYDSRPKRLPPGSSPPSPRPAAGAEPLVHDNGDTTFDRYAPLLTPEELDALMFDDHELTALDSDERRSLIADEPATEPT